MTDFNLKSKCLSRQSLVLFSVWIEQGINLCWVFTPFQGSVEPGAHCQFFSVQPSRLNEKKKKHPTDGHTNTLLVQRSPPV